MTGQHKKSTSIAGVPREKIKNEINRAMFRWSMAHPDIHPLDAPPHIQQREIEKIQDKLGLPASRERTFRIPLGGAKTRKFKFPRLMSKGYCKKTPCKKMGFTQRSSCRPYKNCFTRKRTSRGKKRNL